MNAPISLYPHRPPSLLYAREESSSYDSPETAADWTKVHERIMALRDKRAAHERELCRWLLAAERLGVHARAGYASLREYADRVVGLSGRETEERLRVGRALTELVALDSALASGQLCWSAVREISRVATRETEQAWLGWAKGKRMRQIEKAVAPRRQGDRPDDRPDPSLVKHALRFEVRAETMALFRDLQAAVRVDLGGDVDDDALLFEIARRALGGPDDEGRASYQVAVTRCDECGLTSIDAGGESHAVDEVVAEMVNCDSQRVIAETRPHVRAESRTRATQTIPPAIRRHVVSRDHHRCVVPGCTNHRFLDVHHLDLRSEGGSHDPERLATLCGTHHSAAHAGALAIDGTASGGFTFRHADGTPYGAPMSPPVIDVATQVLGALQHLGFKSKHARELVDTVLRAGAPPDITEFLRAALRAS